MSAGNLRKEALLGTIAADDNGKSNRLARKQVNFVEKPGYVGRLEEIK